MRTLPWRQGRGGIAARLVGGPPKASLDGGKTIANYWPYATTLFDFIRRAMPYTQPRSLTDQEVYSLVAFILAENKLIGEDDEMNTTTLPKVRMPNRDNFWCSSPIGCEARRTQRGILDFNGLQSISSLSETKEPTPEPARRSGRSTDRCRARS